ncbi:MAG: LacI family transcriptional regulator, partial [Chloroflexota bacterium]
DPFFSEFIAGIGNKAAQLGYDLLVSTRTPGNEELQAYKFNVESQRVDGFIVVRTRCEDARIQYLRQVNFPFVSFGRTEGSMDFPYVDEDGEYGMGLVIDYLSGLGHRRIACIAPPYDLMFARHRMVGINKKSASLGMLAGNLTLVEGDLTQRGGYEAAKSILASPNPPTAIMACNDLMALGAMSAAQDLGLVVGKDVSITGFDNIPMAEHSHPPLTTINQPIYQIGTMVCDMLIRRIKGEMGEPEQALLTPSLIVRQSCGPAPLGPLEREEVT